MLKKNNKLFVDNQIYATTELKANQVIFEETRANSDPGTQINIRKLTQGKGSEKRSEEGPKYPNLRKKNF